MKGLVKLLGIALMLYLPYQRINKHTAESCDLIKLIFSQEPKKKDTIVLKKNEKWTRCFDDNLRYVMDDMGNIDSSRS